MKAIRTRYDGQTSRKPARHVAEDGDGNRAYVSASSGTPADAVRLLCERMGWAGTLVAGGFKNHEFWVWDDVDSPRVTTHLTVEMRDVASELREVAPMVGDAVLRKWREGRSYYIDERVNIGVRLRARFERINDMLLARANAIYEEKVAQPNARATLADSLDRLSESHQPGEHGFATEKCDVCDVLDAARAAGIITLDEKGGR